MFGHDDNKHHDEPQHDAVLDGSHTVQPDQPTDDMGMGDDSGQMSPAFTTGAPAADDTASNDDAVSAPDAPSSDESSATTNDSSANVPMPSVPATGGDHDLIGIKQSALKELSPLVGHLDQTPEEKFRTTMMMIQASDDQSLIKDAYAAAQAIPDEKVKAQALLDIVNEINYFTQHSE